jgi:1-acyl-sn-glycerol-3-phosphate acyltransferase
VASQLRPHIAGLDVLERVDPPCVFVANHASHLDTALLLTALPEAWRRRTAVAAAADYFFDVAWRGFSSALVFNTFPIERGRGSGATAPAVLLDEGWNVLVYPEGTRSADGWMGRFRYGAAYLALAASVPVVPVALRGTFAAMPRDRAWPARGRPPVRLRFGPAVRAGPGEEPRAFGDRIRASLARLMDEDASTWWEASRRAAEGTTPDPAGPPVARWRRIWAASAPPGQPASRRAWQ